MTDWLVIQLNFDHVFPCVARWGKERWHPVWRRRKQRSGEKAKEKKRTVQRWVGQVDEQRTRGDLVLEMLWACLSIALTQQWCAKV